MTIDLRSMFQTWVKVLTNPGAGVFEAERLKPSATLTTAIIWMVLAGAATTLLDLFHSQLYSSPLGSMWPLSGQMSSEFFAAMEEVQDRSQLQILSDFVTAPVIFIISVGVQHLIASQLGMDRIRLEPSGENRFAKFGRYAYLNATFTAPVSIVSSLLSFVPLLNCLIIPVLAIYSVVLAYFATRVEYELSRGRAIVVIFVATLIIGGGVALLGGAVYGIG